MNCRDVDEVMIVSGPGASLPPDAAAHVSTCERCGVLARALAETGPPLRPTPDHVKHIEAAILADLKPVKPLAPTGVFFSALLLVFAIVAAAGSAILGTAGWRALSTLQRLSVFAALVAIACLLAFSAARQIAPGSRLLFRPYLLVIAGLAVMGGIFVSLFHPHAESAFVSAGLVCLRIGLEYAVPTGVLSWLLLRRGAFLTPALTGATAGALAGLSGLMVLEIICPNLNEYHILAWHMGAVLVSTLGGLAIGRIVERAGRRRA